MYFCKLVRYVNMKQYRDTEIQFSGLKSGSYTYNYTLKKDFFELFENENLCDGEVNFEVVLEKNERLLMFDFTFAGKVNTQCDRCLGDIEVPVSGKESLCVKFSDTDTSEEEDVVILPEKAYKINLAQWMYEYIMVAMPMQCVHPDDEDGNPTCDPEMLKYLVDEDEMPSAEEEPINDPRWDILKEIKNN